LSSLPSNPLLTKVLSGEWYVGCVESRFAIYLFKIYANSDIYNNRCLWHLRNAMNRFASTLTSNSTVSIEETISEGIMIYACLTLSRSNGCLGLYRHNEICPFVYKTACLVAISSYTCDYVALSQIARLLSRHLLCYAICSSDCSITLNDALDSNYIYDTTITAKTVLLKFNKSNQCKTNIQRVFILTHQTNTKTPSSLETINH
ncbi:MAG: hypothetical protein ACKEQK_00005, partial [Candidatus Hodgkinia cicadicola]